MTQTPQTPAPSSSPAAPARPAAGSPQRLEALGLPVRIGSRRADPPFDWDDARHVGRRPRRRPRRLRHLRPRHRLPRAGPRPSTRSSRQAVAAGARRVVVLLSGRGEEQAEQAEELVKASGADWTIVRCAVFAQNFDEGLLVESVQAGVLAMPRRRRGRAVPRRRRHRRRGDGRPDRRPPRRPAVRADRPAAAHVPRGRWPRSAAAAGRPVQYVPVVVRRVPRRAARLPACPRPRPSGLTQALRRDLRRPQRVARRRRAAGPRPAAPRLRRLRPPGRGHRRLGAPSPASR